MFGSGAHPDGTLWVTLPSRLPSRACQLECHGLCANSCGPIDASAREKQRLRARGVRLPARAQALQILHTTGTYRCPALNNDDSCSAYTDRPTICRLWGAIDALRCPHGCQPHSPPLDDSTALQLLTASHADGDTGALDTGPPPTPDDIARACRTPPYLNDQKPAPLADHAACTRHFRTRSGTPDQV